MEGGQPPPASYKKRTVRLSEDNVLIELVDVLQSIDTLHPLAKLNETTIADNNGGRIEL